jgi:hypothetical protein
MTDLPLSTSDVKQEVKIRLGKEGQAALPPKTVLQCFDEIVERLGSEPALFQKRLIEVRMNGAQWLLEDWTLESSDALFAFMHSSLAGHSSGRY